MNITKLFGCITEISLRASGIAAGVLAIRLLVRKMPGKYGCILWMTAFFAFLIPASVRITCTIPMKAQSGMSAGQAERLRMGIPAEMRYAAQKDKNPNEWHAEYHAVPGRISAESTDVYHRILAAVWAAGIVIFLIWQTYRYWHLKRILSVAVRKSGNVYVSDKVDSPFLMGLLAPNIYLPANMDEKTAYFAVLHEQMHQQRKDYLVKFAVFLICACYWWNPVIWLMYCLFGKDMERSCDEAVLEYGNVCRTEYAQALLDAVCRSRISAFGLKFAAGTTKSRVRYILNFQKEEDRKKMRYILPALITVAVCVIQPEVNVSGTEEKAMTEVWNEVASEYTGLPEYKILENRDEYFHEREGYMRVQIVPAVNWDEMEMKMSNVSEKFLSRYEGAEAVVFGWKSPVSPENYPIDSRCSFGTAVHYRNEYASLADTVQEEGSSADISDKSHLPEEFWEDRIREYTGFPEYYVYRDYNPYEKEQKKGLLFIRVFGTYNWYMSKDFMKVWKKPVTEIAGQIIEQFEEIKEVRVCWDETIGKKGRSGAGVKPVGIIQMAKYK